MCCTPWVPWLEPGDHVSVADLLAAEQDEHVRIGQGDIVLVRVGHRRRRSEQGPWNAAEARAGLHPTVLPLLAERRIAALGSDGNNDTAPSAVADVDFPVHVLAVNALGLHLLDYLQFTELSRACAETQRWSFLCVIAPLRLPTGDRVTDQSNRDLVTATSRRSPAGDHMLACQAAWSCSPDAVGGMGGTTVMTLLVAAGFCAVVRRGRACRSGRRARPPSGLDGDSVQGRGDMIHMPRSGPSGPGT
jgi:hypothetical protein